MMWITIRLTSDCSAVKPEVVGDKCPDPTLLPGYKYIFGNCESVCFTPDGDLLFSLIYSDGGMLFYFIPCLSYSYCEVNGAVVYDLFR